MERGKPLYGGSWISAFFRVQGRDTVEMRQMTMVSTEEIVRRIIFNTRKKEKA